MAQRSDASVHVLLVDKLELAPAAAEMATEQPQSPLREEGTATQTQEVATQPQENGLKKAATTFLNEAVETHTHTHTSLITAFISLLPLMT